MLLLSACSGGHNAKPTTSTTSATTDHTDAKAHSQRVLDDVIEAGAPGCSAAVGIKGQVVWTGVRGVADISTGNPITAHTVFDIASVSKQFTATALLLLVHGGKLALTDPLSRYVPELPTWATTVTVGQLMHQTSGIPEYVGLLEAQGFELSDRTTQEEALQALAGVPKLEFQPGSQFEYSNSNYLLLGEIVRRVSREPLPQLLSEQIFQPLALTMVVDPTGPIPDKAIAYEKGSEGYRATKSGWEQVGTAASRPPPANWSDGRTITGPAAWAAPVYSTRNYPVRCQPNRAVPTGMAPGSTCWVTACSITTAPGADSSPRSASARTERRPWRSAAIPTSKARKRLPTNWRNSGGSRRVARNPMRCSSFRARCERGPEPRLHSIWGAMRTAALATPKPMRKAMTVKPIT